MENLERAWSPVRAWISVDGVPSQAVAIGAPSIRIDPVAQMIGLDFVGNAAVASYPISKKLRFEVSDRKARGMFRCELDGVRGQLTLHDGSPLNCTIHQVPPSENVIAAIPEAGRRLRVVTAIDGPRQIRILSGGQVEVSHDAENASLTIYDCPCVYEDCLSIYVGQPIEEMSLNVLFAANGLAQLEQFEGCDIVEADTREGVSHRALKLSYRNRGVVTSGLGSKSKESVAC